MHDVFGGQLRIGPRRLLPVGDVFQPEQPEHLALDGGRSVRIVGVVQLVIEGEARARRPVPLRQLFDSGPHLFAQLFRLVQIAGGRSQLPELFVNLLQVGGGALDDDRNVQRPQRVRQIARVVGDDHQVGLVGGDGLHVGLPAAQVGDRNPLREVGLVVHRRHLAARPDGEQHFGGGGGQGNNRLRPFRQSDRKTGPRHGHRKIGFRRRRILPGRSLPGRGEGFAHQPHQIHQAGTPAVGQFGVQPDDAAVAHRADGAPSVPGGDCLGGGPAGFFVATEENHIGILFHDVFGGQLRVVAFRRQQRIGDVHQSENGHRLALHRLGRDRKQPFVQLVVVGAIFPRGPEPFAQSVYFFPHPVAEGHRLRFMAGGDPQLQHLVVGLVDAGGGTLDDDRDAHLFQGFPETARIVGDYRQIRLVGGDGLRLGVQAVQVGGGRLGGKVGMAVHRRHLAARSDGEQNFGGGGGQGNDRLRRLLQVNAEPHPFQGGWKVGEGGGDGSAVGSPVRGRGRRCRLGRGRGSQIHQGGVGFR